MFWYIYEEYVDKVYKKNNLKKLGVKDIIMIIAFILLGASTIVSMILKFKIVSYILGVVFLVLTTYLGYTSSIDWKKNRIIYMKEYKEDKINELKKILEGIGEFEEKKIDWLIDSCEKNISDIGKEKIINISKGMIAYIAIPTVTSCFTILASNLNTEDLVVIIGVIAFATVILVGVDMIIYPFVKLFIESEKRKVERFREDLLYIKIEYFG